MEHVMVVGRADVVGTVLVLLLWLSVGIIGVGGTWVQIQRARQRRGGR